MGKVERKIPVLQPTFGDTEAMIEKFRGLFRSGQITLGRYTRQLEDKVAETLDVEHVIAVSSCTAGLMLALKALGLSGEVILPSFTFAATAHAALWCGLRPVFCECDPDTLSLDLDHAGLLVNDRTTTLMPVYIFGAPPDWDRVTGFAAARGLKVVADAAQGLGSSFRGRKAGGFGEVEIFSMSPTKVVTAAEGGLVTTRDGGLAQELRRMRDYGKAEDGEDMGGAGLSARLSEFHAVIGLENFRRLEEWKSTRRHLIGEYRARLDGIPGIRYPVLPEGAESSWNYMVLLVSEAEAPFSRDRLFLGLKQKGIQTKRYFYPPVHRLSVYRRQSGGAGPRLPVTEKVSAQALALPLFTHMEEETVQAVCDAVHSLC